MERALQNEQVLARKAAPSESEGLPERKWLWNIHPLFVKNGILLLLLAFALIFLLFTPIMSMHYRNIPVQFDFTGLSLLIAVLSGMVGKFTGSAMGNVQIEVPAVPAALLLTGILLIVALIVLVCVYTFVLKRESRVLGFALLGGAAYFLIIFLVLILSNSIVVKGLDNPVLLEDWPLYSPFYQRYELGVSMLIAIVALAFAGYFQLITKVARVEKIKKYWVMYVLLIVPTLLVFIFSLYPIFLQTIMSFKDYSGQTVSSGIWGSDWVGFDNFKRIFTDSAMLKVIGNTLLISACRIVIQIIPPIILAIMLFDMGHDRIRKVLQTILYIPHFFSWVIIYAIAFGFLNAEGVINAIIKALGGTPYTFFNNEAAFIPILLITDLWKELGWGTILYLASLSGIDQSQYEAAAVDGAGPMQKLFKITLPNMKPIIVFMSIMAVGNLLKGAGGEQILLFGSSKMEIAQVIDTWVIWYGLNGDALYSVSAAMSFFQALIGIIMVLSCNKLSKKYAGVGMW